MSDPSSSTPSTPEATAGVAQSKEERAATESPRPLKGGWKAMRAFDVSSLIERHVDVQHYKRKSEDPVYRPLRIFALDPALSRLEGAVASSTYLTSPSSPAQKGGSSTWKTIRMTRRIVTLKIAGSCSRKALLPRDPITHFKIRWSMRCAAQCTRPSRPPLAAIRRGVLNARLATAKIIEVL